MIKIVLFFNFFIFFGGLECVGHSFAYVEPLVFLRDVWIRTKRAAVASRRATNLAIPPTTWPVATHPPKKYKLIFGSKAGLYT